MSPVTTELTTKPRRGVKKQQLRKPKWPYPHVTRMAAHPTKRWAKKIRGVLRYFGHWSDPKAALERYQQLGQFYHNGELPPTEIAGGGLTVEELFARFLDFKNQRIGTTDGPKGKTVADYYRICKHAVGVLGRSRNADSLHPSDFGRLRQALAERYGAFRLNVSVTVIRGAMKWAFQNGLLTAQPRFGTMFDKASRSAIRAARASKPQRKFSASEIRRIVAASSKHLAAMVLLGINGGFESAQFATLSTSDVNLKRGVIDFVRGKTNVRRTVTLWPETVAALKRSLRQRHKPTDPQHEKSVLRDEFRKPVLA